MKGALLQVLWCKYVREFTRNYANCCGDDLVDDDGVLMKMMVIAKDVERIVEVFDSSELPGASDTFSGGFILFLFYIVKTVSYI